MSERYKFKTPRFVDKQICLFIESKVVEKLSKGFHMISLQAYSQRETPIVGWIWMYVSRTFKHRGRPHKQWSTPTKISFIKRQSHPTNNTKIWASTTRLEWRIQSGTTIDRHEFTELFSSGVCVCHDEQHSLPITVDFNSTIFIPCQPSSHGIKWHENLSQGFLEHFSFEKIGGAICLVEVHCREVVSRMHQVHIRDRKPLFKHILTGADND
ncbi:hypothetical protein SADUNF_Sadunf19G0012900 [Salix dunnii]|uniref:Uncharacterized protein n=1 Tax=Salix dunnii TaxID=1413687 RepID=A0A835J162_9ROSI|nr:hypothetical protein SADUNF_Sadunf19G0012900 [Salix dunnii]